MYILPRTSANTITAGGLEHTYTYIYTIISGKSMYIKYADRATHLIKIRFFLEHDNKMGYICWKTKQNGFKFIQNTVGLRFFVY